MEPKVTPPLAGKVLPPNGSKPKPYAELSKKTKSVIIDVRKKVPRKVAIGFAVLIVIVLAYLYAGADAIVRRGNLGIGDKIALKTASGYVTQTKFDAVVAALKYFGYKDTPKASAYAGKPDLPSAKDAAQKVLAAEGYLENTAKKAKISLNQPLVEALLKNRYETKTKQEFYKQFKNPSQMETYFNVIARTDIYKSQLESELLKGKEVTLLTISNITPISAKPPILEATKAQALLAAVQKDVQNNFRPSLLNKTSVDAAKKAIKDKKINTNGVTFSPVPKAEITKKHYSAELAITQTSQIKAAEAGAVTEVSILNGLKVGDVSAATTLTFGQVVVLRYDADRSSNPFTSWTELTPAAVKTSKVY